MKNERKIERFDKYMMFKGLNDNKVTLDLGLSVGTIGKSRAEGRDLSERNIEKILNFYTDLDRVWLLTGEGEMLKQATSASNDEKLPSIDVDENAVRQRISSILEKEKSSIYALSKETGVEQTKLNRQLRGSSRLSFDTIKVFLQRFPRISADWLLRGVGDMCCGIPDEQLEREIAEETGRVQHIGDNSNHNTQTMTDSAIDKENKMLMKSIEEKNEEIKFLRSLIQRNTD